jgi:hypothetical protein
MVPVFYVEDHVHTTDLLGVDIPKQVIHHLFDDC